MRWLIFLPLMLLAGSAEADVVETIKQQCKAQWPNDYSMQVFCIDKQAGAARDFLQLAEGEAAKGELREILATCLERWGADKGSPDWPMVTYCYRKEQQAWSTLKKL